MALPAYSFSIYITVFLKEITFRNFRNYDSLNLQFSEKISLVTGENAQGKTNILEGIYFLSTAKSHRTNRDDELIQQGKHWFYIKGRIQSRLSSNSVEITNTCGEKKRIRINGKTQDKISSIIGKINVVMFSPEDLSLVKGAPSERRRFLDILISRISPSYLYALQEYNSSLRQRNELLKNIRDKKAKADSLESWDILLAKSGSEIIKQRLAVVSELSEIAREKHSQLTSDQEDFHIEYQTQFDFNSDSRIEDIYRENLDSSIDSDLRRGSTSTGPHRDDLMFSVDCVDARRYCSQGQQRTSVLSLKMADLELMARKLNDYPIVLLDDVTSELDENRASFLFDLLNQTPVQAFLTATNLEGISSKFPNSQLFAVENGVVKKR
ncbi:DNA replication/repair protein RecF [Candidatus Poribacteria bacterium]|nr:DNA replication/repair protein RecF [Candidatus Poribacteria bacterium]